MKKHSPENERIKRQYFAYLKEAKRHERANGGCRRKGAEQV